jgi:O-antigen/teichoic acid export membrane protein
MPASAGSEIMLRHTTLYFGVRAVNGVLGLATLSLLTQWLAPAEYGRYALGASAISVGSSILFQWLNVSVSRFHGRGEDTDARLLSEAVRMFLVIATAAALVAAVIVVLHGDDLLVGRGFIVAVTLGCAAMGLHNLHLQIVNSRGQPLRYGLITSTRASIALLGATIALRVGWGVTGALMALTLGCVIAVGMFGARWPLRLASGNVALRRELITYGLPLSATFLATMIIDASDRFLIGGLLGVEAVAPYAASYDLTQQTVGVALNVFFLALYPRITRAWENEGEAGARRELAPLTRCIALMAPFVVGIFAAFATPIARLLLGTGVREQASQLMPLIALAIALGGAKSYLLDIPLLLQRRVSAQLAITFAMALANIALNVALLPTLGIFGSAIAAVASFGLGAVISFVLGRGTQLVRLGLRDLAAATAAAAGLWLAGRGTLNIAQQAGLPVLASVAVAALSGIGLFVVLAVVLDLGGAGGYARRWRSAW